MVAIGDWPPRNGFGIYAFRREARRVENFRTGAELQLEKEKFLRRIARFTEKRVGFGLGILSTVAQFPEGIDVLYENSHDGQVMIAKTVAALSLLLVGQAWMEFQWRKSARLCERERSTAPAPAKPPPKPLTPPAAMGPRPWSRPFVLAFTDDDHPFCPVPSKRARFATAPMRV